MQQFPQFYRIIWFSPWGFWHHETPSANAVGLSPGSWSSAFCRHRTASARAVVVENSRSQLWGKRWNDGTERWQCKMHSAHCKIGWEENWKPVFFSKKCETARQMGIKWFVINILRVSVSERDTCETKRKINALYRCRQLDLCTTERSLKIN